jgi:hypothetical protein
MICSTCATFVRISSGERSLTGRDDGLQGRWPQLVETDDRGANRQCFQSSVASRERAAGLFVVANASGGLSPAAPGTEAMKQWP